MEHNYRNFTFTLTVVSARLGATLLQTNVNERAIYFWVPLTSGLFEAMKRFAGSGNRVMHLAQMVVQ